MNMQLDDLEQQLAGLAESAPSGVSADGVHHRVVRRRRRRLAVRSAAGVVCTAAVVAGLVAINRPHSTIAPSGSNRGDQFIGATDPPYLSGPGDGWTVRYFNDTIDEPSPLVVVDAERGFAGGSFELQADGSGNFADGRDLNSEGLDGEIGARQNNSQWISWTVDGVSPQAIVRQLSEADAIEIARRVTLAPDGTPQLSEPPAGLVVLTPDERANADRRVEYQWSGPNGKALTVTLTPGGDIGVQVPAGDPTFHQATVNGHAALVQNDGQRYVWVDGFWVWVVFGEGYSDPAELASVVAAVSVTDRATWEAELAGHAVLPEQRLQVVTSMVADIPLPPGFDIAPFTRPDRAVDRYQLITQVTGAAFCGWLDQWNLAVTAGDSVGAAAASGALVASKQWAALVEINSQGGWADEMWRAADRVAAGDRSIAAEAVSSLGCFAIPNSSLPDTVP